jgi:nucleotide-binding universal stress UspA family protein
MEEIKRIMVVNRLTAHCRDALRVGVSLAKKYGSELSVIHIISNPVDMEAVNAPGLFLKGEEYKNYMNIREQAKEALDKVIRHEVKNGLPIKEIVTAGEPVKEIVRTVREEKVDLIIMLAQEEGRLEHILFGGENDRLIRILPCSILMVKHEPKPIRW